MKRKSKPKPYERQRKVPVQVYMSEHERAELRMLETERGVTASDLVRTWIKRAIAASRANDVRVLRHDPRQLRLAE